MMAAYVFIVMTSLVTAFIIDKVTGLLVFIGFAGIPFMPIPGIVLFICCLVLILYKVKLEKQRDKAIVNSNSKADPEKDDDQLFMLSEEELEKFFDDDNPEKRK